MSLPCMSDIAAPDWEVLNRDLTPLEEAQTLQAAVQDIGLLMEEASDLLNKAEADDPRVWAKLTQARKLFEELT